jgi:hypothetical protein
MGRSEHKPSPESPISDFTATCKYAPGRVCLGSRHVIDIDVVGGEPCVGTSLSSSEPLA